MDLTTATPAEIDTALSEIHDNIAEARFKADRIWSSVQSGARDYLSLSWHAEITKEQISEALRDAHENTVGFRAKALVDAHSRYTDACDKVTEHIISAQPYDEEYTRRGGWTRAFLVLNNNGHVHSSRYCKTTFDTTRWGWLPEMSGLTEDEIVAAAGSDACTVCYPSAPVVAKPRSVFHHTEKTAQAARDARAAAKAERAAKKAAKSLLQPVAVFDYRSPEKRDTAGNVVREAQDRFHTLETIHAAKGWLTDHFEAVQHNWGKPKRQEDVMTVAEALAAKNGTSVDEELEAASKRARRRWK